MQDGFLGRGGEGGYAGGMSGKLYPSPPKAEQTPSGRNWLPCCRPTPPGAIPGLPTCVRWSTGFCTCCAAPFPGPPEGDCLIRQRRTPWGTVWWYFRNWRDDGTWERVEGALRSRIREAAGREATPSAAIIDSQSVKTTEKGGPGVTMLAKRVAGRKRHIVVDTMGLLLAVVVSRAAESRTTQGGA